MRRERGFTIIELIITMAVFSISLYLVGRFFADQLTMFKQQSKMTESNIEGIIGLEILRRDIEHAGYGLPWSFQSALKYPEAAGAPATDFNDGNPPNDPGNPPRAILSGNNVSYAGVVKDSDYLVIKSVNLGTSATSARWTMLQSLNTPPFKGDYDATYNPRTWTPATENFEAGDRLIVLAFGSSGDRQLIMSGAAFSLSYGAGGANLKDKTKPWTPSSDTELHIVYGVDPDTNLQMPFNRADYFISTASVPSLCSPGTGVLKKGFMSQSNGSIGDTMPLLDCVADMQVFYGVDTSDPVDGTINCYANDLADALTTVDAVNIRNRVKEIRVYILAHEGQADRTFRFTSPTGTALAADNIRVGVYKTELPSGTASCKGDVLGRDFDLSKTGPNWRNYRWKVYTMIVTPHNLL